MLLMYSVQAYNTKEKSKLLYFIHASIQITFMEVMAISHRFTELEERRLEGSFPHSINDKRCLTIQGVSTLIPPLHTTY